MLSKTALFILGIISEKPINPYAISKLVNYKRKDIKKSSIIPPSSIYGIISKLQKKKFITSKQSKSGNMPSKKIYSITPKGKELLKESTISYLSNPEAGLSGLLLGITLMGYLDKEVILKALNEYRKEIRREITIRKKLFSLENTPTLYDTNLIGLKHVINILKVNLKTVNELVKKIEEDRDSRHSPIPFWRFAVIQNGTPDAAYHNNWTTS